MNCFIKWHSAALFTALAFAMTAPKAGAAAPTAPLRPPAAPLVTFDPYLSIWSEADHLTDDVTRHWTHHPQALVSLIRVDGKAYRLMGNDPAEVPPMPQTGLEVFPTRTVYQFDSSQVHVTMTFMTAALPHDLNVLAWPLSYIDWRVRSNDGRPHTISLYDSTSSQLAVNTLDEKVVWARKHFNGLTALKVGTEAQPILASSGDDIRIDWGYAYAAAPENLTKAAIGNNADLLNSFVENGSLPAHDDTDMPRAVQNGQPVMAFVFSLGEVGKTTAERHMMVAYDERYAIKYYGQPLRPYWRRNGATMNTLLPTAYRDYDTLAVRCQDFDHSLMADAAKAGGEKYAQIAALAYRQCLAACGLAADSRKQPLLFTKENTSNGDIATVDVIFPMDPMMVLLSPTLAEASLVPDLAYAASPHWKFPNAPHDLGTYPLVFGRDDGGEGMPVEESGNMLILCDAIAQEEGSPKFVAKWWPQLTQWNTYLLKYGNDPEDQLCTDDFMGHLAHNANLSVKAILGIAAYGDLCRMRGDEATANKLQKMARGFARHWMEVANDGSHYRLAFDRPNTWSQLYNLVWDKVLHLHIFPPQVAQKEIAFYKTVMQPYGLPLDSRTHLTKTDWSTWTATLADSKQTFESFMAPIYRYLNTTTARSPLVDSYITDNIHSDGMHARPVVGGIFIKMLADPALWKKWSSGDTTLPGSWAPLPVAPKVITLVPTSRHTPQVWSYTTEKPADDWFQPGFDASSWQSGPGGFGTAGTPAVAIHTTWNTDDIWIRREFTMPKYPAGAKLCFSVFHDEDVEIYLNGVPAARESGFISDYEELGIMHDALALLKPGAHIVMAVHCHQTTGGQGIDVGIGRIAPGK